MECKPEEIWKSLLLSSQRQSRYLRTMKVNSGELWGNRQWRELPSTGGRRWTPSSALRFLRTQWPQYSQRLHRSYFQTCLWVPAHTKARERTVPPDIPVPGTCWFLLLQDRWPSFIRPFGAIADGGAGQADTSKPTRAFAGPLHGRWWCALRPRGFWGSP